MKYGTTEYYHARYLRLKAEGLLERNKERYASDPAWRAQKKDQARRRHARMTEDERYAERRRQYVGNVVSYMATNARSRAKERGLPCDITWRDIVIPAVCPVLGIPLVVSVGQVTEGSPTLDRIIPELGYVKGNIIVVSELANRIKTNATPEQIMRVGQFYQAALAAKAA